MDKTVDEQVQKDDVQDTPQYTDIELRAMDMGWRPREEFNGADEDFIEAKEYVNRKPLFDKIEYQSKELKSVKRALDALKTHYTKVQETEYERALNSLKQQRKQALTEGDGDKFEAVDVEIKNVERQAREIKAIHVDTSVPEVNPEFQSWLNKNTWYNDTQYMRAFADDYGTRLAANGMAPSEVLVQVEKAVRKEFPQKFRNPNKEDAGDVGNSRSARNTSSRQSSDEAGLNEQERKIMNDLVRSGVMTKEKYIADLKAVKARD